MFGKSSYSKSINNHLLYMKPACPPCAPVQAIHNYSVSRIEAVLQKPLLYLFSHLNDGFCKHDGLESSLLAFVVKLRSLTSAELFRKRGSESSLQLLIRGRQVLTSVSAH